MSYNRSQITMGSNKDMDSRIAIEREIEELKEERKRVTLDPLLLYYQRKESLEWIDEKISELTDKLKGI